MLQRIQTIWLLLAAVCSFLTLKFPFFTGTPISPIPAATTVMYLTAATYIPILILTIVVFIAALLTIFLYKNRKLQLRISFVAALFSLLIVVLYFLQMTKFASGTYSLTALLSLAAPVFLVLAARGIYKDEKLVKSLDRLR